MIFCSGGEFIFKILVSLYLEYAHLRPTMVVQAALLLSWLWLRAQCYYPGPQLSWSSLRQPHDWTLPQSAVAHGKANTRPGVEVGHQESASMQIDSGAEALRGGGRAGGASRLLCGCGGWARGGSVDKLSGVTVVIDGANVGYFHGGAQKMHSKAGRNFSTRGLVLAIEVCSGIDIDTSYALLE